MAQQARKNGPRPQVVERVEEIVQKTEKKVIEMERQGIEGVMRAADNVNHVAAQCLQTCCGNLAACVESGSTTTRLFTEISHEMMEDISRTFTDYMSLSKEVIVCRTLEEVAELQNKLARQRTDRFFERSQKWFGLLFDGYKEAMEPLETQSYVASDQICKAMAA